jgi:hypothetical protein
MKIDKRTLIKHHFWIVSVVCLLLIITLPPLILMNVGAAVEKRNEETKGALSKINAQNKAKTKKDTRELEERTKDWIKNQDVLWKFNWETQKDLFHWQPISREHYAENTANQERDIDQLPFMFPLNTQNFFTDAFSKEYDKIYEHLKLLALPIMLDDQSAASGDLSTPKGPKGPMPGFPGGGRPGRGRPFGPGVGSFDDSGPRGSVARSGVLHKIELPKDSELPDQNIWLAMEDYWVQRELIASLRRANEDVCVLRDVRSAAEKKANPDKLVLRSRIWELTVDITPAGNNKKLELKLKNISPRKLAINRVEFQLQLTKGDPLSVVFEEQYIAVDQTVKKVIDVDVIKLAGEPHPEPHAWAGIFDDKLPADVAREFPNLKMALDPRFTPIKQLIDLEMGEAARSSRNASKEMLKPKLWKERNADAGGGGPRFPGGGKGFGSPGMTGPGSMPSTGMPGSMAPGRGEGDDGSTSTVEKVTPEGLQIYRYINVTDAVRRMPVALVYTVDQAFNQDVLVSLVNSKLRLQITQVHWQRTRDSLPPTAPSGYRPGSFVGGKGGRDTTDRPGGGPGSFPGFGLPGGFPGSSFFGSEVEFQDDGAPPPLIEVGVYGIASLYERYPPMMVGPQPGGKLK